MIDEFGLVQGQPSADVQVFRAGGQWETWIKPRGKTMMMATIIGGGGGGSGGAGTR